MPSGPGGINQATPGNIKIIDCSYDDGMCVDVQNSSKPEQITTQTTSNTTTCGQQVNSTTSYSNTFNLEKQHLYNKTNIYVLIEKTNDENIGRLHPMKIGDLLHHRLNLGDSITTIEKSGINRVKVGVKSVQIANNLI